MSSDKGMGNWVRNIKLRTVQVIIMWTLCSMYNLLYFIELDTGSNIALTWLHSAVIKPLRVIGVPEDSTSGVVDLDIGGSVKARHLRAATRRPS